MKCRGLKGKQKRRDVLHYLRNKTVSIICLQDVHFDKNMESIVKAEWGGEAYFSSFSSNARGVVILLSNNLDYKIHASLTDKEGNWVALDISINNVRVTLVTIYGPNEDKPTFYDGIKRVVENLDNPHCILCGDWNLVQDQTLDTFNYFHVNNPKARKTVLEIKNHFNLIDPWRHQNQHVRRYTWRQPTPLKQSWIFSDIRRTYNLPFEIRY